MKRVVAPCFAVVTNRVRHALTSFSVFGALLLHLLTEEEARASNSTVVQHSGRVRAARWSEDIGDRELRQRC